MVAFDPLRLIFLLVWVQGFPALQWTAQTQSHTLIQSCVGQNITFPWFFTVDAGENVVDIKWLFTSADSNTPVEIATYGIGTFIVIPSLALRLHHLGNGSIELTHSTLGDSGNYTVDVSVHKGGVFSEIRHTITVQVAMPPSSNGGQLSVTQTDQAVRDNSTGELHVQLECGRLSSRGQPPVDVVWTTPSGSAESSSYNDNGNFYLLLRNPVKGGNYSCRLPPNSAATLCLAGDDPLLRETTVFVDTVLARLTLVEAKEEALKEENRQLLQELKNARQHTNTTVTDINTRLDQYYAKSSERVSFHAVLSSSHGSNSIEHIKFNDIKYNDGGAYSAATGDFTAPLNGSYFFVFSASAYSSGQTSNAYLKADGTIVARTYNKYSDYYNMATAHAALHLVKGQKVWVESLDGNHYYYSVLSFFSGFLFHSDW